MKKQLLFFLILLSPLFILSQHIEVLGVVKADSIDVNSGLIKNVADPVSDQDAATKAYVDAKTSSLPTITTYAVGDFAHGGIVFWVDETGQHGLVCAKNDQSSGIRWFAGAYGVVRARGDGVYAGKANTTIIISSQVAIGDDGLPYAAQICHDLQVTEGETTFGDWYLPSLYELDLMYENKATIDSTALANGGGGFSDNYYWSSTENAGTVSAWTQGFTYNDQGVSDKSFASDVRAVRAF